MCREELNVQVGGDGRRTVALEDHARLHTNGARCLDPGRHINHLQGQAQGGVGEGVVEARQWVGPSMVFSQCTATQ